MGTSKKKIICCTYKIDRLKEDQPASMIPLELFLDDHMRTVESGERWYLNIKLNAVNSLTDFKDDEIDASRLEVDARTISMSLLRSEDSKPYTGDLDSDFLKPIEGNVFEHSTWLVIPSRNLLFYVYDHHAPKQTQLQNYLNHFLKDKNLFISIERKLSKKTMEELDSIPRFSELQLQLDAYGKNPIFTNDQDIPHVGFATRIKSGVETLNENALSDGFSETSISFKLDPKNKEDIGSKEAVMSLIKLFDVESDSIKGLKVKAYKQKDFIDLKNADKVYFSILLSDRGYEYVAKELILKYQEIQNNI